MCLEDGLHSHGDTEGRPVVFVYKSPLQSCRPPITSVYKPLLLIRWILFNLQNWPCLHVFPVLPMQPSQEISMLSQHNCKLAHQCLLYFRTTMLVYVLMEEWKLAVYQ